MTEGDGEGELARLLRLIINQALTRVLDLRLPFDIQFNFMQLTSLCRMWRVLT